MRQVANAEYKDGYVDAYDERGVMLVHTRCDKLVGYGPSGFVAMRGNCYWIHNANGTNAMSPMTPCDFGKKKWEMHDTFLRIMC